MLNESNIRCFLTLAETLNFTQTAKMRYMSQQAVSQNISRLEEDVGYPLFVRSKHFVTLTTSGRALYELFSQTTQDYHTLVTEGRNRYAELSSYIRVGYQKWMDFGPALSLGMERMEGGLPNLRVETERENPGILRERLMNHKLDMILIYERFTQRLEGVQRLRLLEVPIVLMVSARNPLIKPDSTYQTFAREPFILDKFHDEEDTEAQKRAKTEVSMCGLHPTELMVMNNRDSAYTAAELGRGVVLTTPLSRISSSRHLVAYPTDRTEYITCVWNEGEENDIVARYANCLQQAYKEISLT